MIQVLLLSADAVEFVGFCCADVDVIFILKMFEDKDG